MVTDYRKQTNLIEVEEVTTPIHVIGCGALGSWLTFFLLKMGFKNITVYDFDKIEEHNLPNQFFREDQIGKPKVEAIKELYESFNDNDTDRLTICDRKLTVSGAKKLDGIVLCAVDSMAARKYIFENTVKNGNVDLFVEARLSIYGAYVYALTKGMDFTKYEGTLYADTEAEVSPCGVSQTALPAAVNAASIMIMQMIEYLNGNQLTNKLEYSIPWMDKMEAKW
jgi:adenylyltransferase/sulfurtransferase